MSTLEVVQSVPAPAPEALWDPLNAWPAGRRWLWALLALVACIQQGPGFVSSLRPARGDGVDFFQEWASGRNLLSGLPVYGSHKLALERHLGYHLHSPDGPRVDVAIDVNAHPPTSVLVLLPLAALNYPDAVLVWNLLSLAALGASLWLIGRQLGIALAPWCVFPLLALLMLCNPLRQQVNQGQLNLFLLLLLVGTWVAERSGRTASAGALLAVATAIKLFPGLLFLYLLVRRQYRALVAGALTFAAITAVSVLVLGPETYRMYCNEIVHETSRFRSGWGNASLPGLWAKLFEPDSVNKPIESLWHSPAAAKLATGLSVLLLLALLAWSIYRARTRPECDRAFALTLTAMLLVSPITWDHYLLLLALPLTLLWLWLPSSGLVRWSFVLVAAALWWEPLMLYNALIPGGHDHGLATPFHTLTVLSFQCYALLGLFVLGMLVGPSGRQPVRAGPRPAAKRSGIPGGGF
jgi:hypothetical protein